jgi:hypothetical protein
MWIVIQYLMDQVTVFLVQSDAALPASKSEPIALLRRPRKIVMKGIPTTPLPSASDMPAKSIVERSNEILERLNG